MPCSARITAWGGPASASHSRCGNFVPWRALTTWSSRWGITFSVPKGGVSLAQLASTRPNRRTRERRKKRKPAILKYQPDHGGGETARQGARNHGPQGQRHDLV